MGGLRVPLFLIGAVALLSGGLKARERVRVYYGGVGMGLLEILVGVACLAATLPGIASNDTMATLISLAGGVIFISTVSRGLTASRLRKGREESESRRLYSQIKYRKALGGAKLPAGFTQSQRNTISGESPAEGSASTDLIRAGDSSERSPADEPPTTIDRKDPWTD